MEKINIKERFTGFSDHWNPRIIADLNGQQVKLARLKGEFVWHRHDSEDELFYILEGTLRMELRDQTIILEPGEMLVVPRGVEHRPVAADEVLLMLFEPATTVNTGNIENEMTRRELERI